MSAAGERQAEDAGEIAGALDKLDAERQPDRVQLKLCAGVADDVVVDKTGAGGDDREGRRTGLNAAARGG